MVNGGETAELAAVAWEIGEGRMARRESLKKLKNQQPLEKTSDEEMMF